MSVNGVRNARFLKPSPTFAHVRSRSTSRAVDGRSENATSHFGCWCSSTAVGSRIHIEAVAASFPLWFTSVTTIVVDHFAGHFPDKSCYHRWQIILRRGDCGLGRLTGSDPFFNILGAFQEVAEDGTVHTISYQRFNQLTVLTLRDSVLFFVPLSRSRLTLRHVNVSSATS